MGPRGRPGTMTQFYVHLQLTPEDAHLVRRALVRLGVAENTTPQDQERIVGIVDYIQHEQDDANQVTRR